MKIEGHAFLVTGGASGLGLASARAIVAAGGQVMLVDVDAEKGTAAAGELGAAARFVRTDITSAEDGEAAVAAAVGAFGGLRGLVNCAGVAPAARIVGRDGAMALEKYDRVVQINLVGTFNMLRLAAAAIQKEAPLAETGERGVIVNTASIAAWDGQMGQAAYASSKGGVAALTLPAAREFARAGIRVMCIAPGIFETPMMAGMSQEVQDGLAEGVPFPKRLGKPAEYAALMRHIIENPYLNGEVIRLDAALRMA